MSLTATILWILPFSLGGFWLGQILTHRKREKGLAETLEGLQSFHLEHVERVREDTARRVRETAAKMIEHQFNCNRQRERDGLPKSWGCSYCDVADKVREIR